MAHYVCGAFTMNKFIRIAIALFTAVAIKFFSFWIFIAMGPRVDWRAGIDAHWKTRVMITTVLSWVCALVAGLFVWWMSGSIAHPQRVARCAIFGAILLGAIGFAAGFFGPIILTPHSNQGPLLGIFFTGPAGVVVGAIAGAIYGRFKRVSTENSAA
jgi:hypothetical protein